MLLPLPVVSVPPLSQVFLLMYVFRPGKRKLLVTLCFTDFHRRGWRGSNVQPLISTMFVVMTEMFNTL